MKLIDVTTRSFRKKVILAAGFYGVSLILLAPHALTGALQGRHRPPVTLHTVDEVTEPTTLRSQEIPPSIPRHVSNEILRPEVLRGNWNSHGFVVPTASAPASSQIPSPTPDPVRALPELVLAAISPASVYAATGSFTLELAGDKFTNQSHVAVDGRDIPTTFLSAQRLTAEVPAEMIDTPGGRSINVRTPGAAHYSNTITLNVATKPTPPFSYVGLVARTDEGNDVVILKEYGFNDYISVVCGQVIAGQWEVTNISEQAVVLTNVQNGIKQRVLFGSNIEDGLAAAYQQPDIPEQPHQHPAEQQQQQEEGSEDHEP